MEPLKEAISVRSARLNNQVLGRSANNSAVAMKCLAREGLLDALTVLYDECNNDTLKKSDKNIALFIDKYRSTILDLKRLRVNICDFEVKNIIGRGHFGEVNVVREKQTGDVYAMKTLRKCDSMGKYAMSFYEEERDIMANTQSPWLTSLQYAFQDMAHLYLVMEFHPGGDLLGLLERRGNGSGIGEAAACFYLAELSLAIHALHCMGYVHRDIKPDNVLLDRCGHLKLADFGSASKLNPSGFVTSAMPAGTPDYIAPEVLVAVENSQTEKYGISCDYWSLGVVAYELLTGRTPFSSEAIASTYSKIMNHRNATNELEFPEEVSAEYASFVNGLLIDCKNRLTHPKIVSHELFRDVVWDKLREQVPPFVPIVNGCDDTSNFEDFEHKPSQPSIDNFRTRTQFTGRHLPFIGFTYIHNMDTDILQSVQTKTYVDLNVTLNRNVENPLEGGSRERKTIEGLQERLIRAERHSQDAEALERRLAEKVKRVESAEAVRDRLERELAAFKNDNKNLKRMLDMERKERKTFEGQALELIASTKAKWELNGNARITALTKDLNQREERIREMDTANGKLAERLEKAQKDLQDKIKELEKIKDMQLECKNSIAKVQEKSRQSIMGAEVRLESIAAESRHQLDDLQKRLESEKKRRKEFERKCAEFEQKERSQSRELVKSNERTEKLQEKIKTLELQLDELIPLRDQLPPLMKKLQDLQSERKDFVKFKGMEEILKRERSELENLQKQVKVLKNDLMHSQNSLERHETSLTARNQQREALIETLRNEIKVGAAERECLKQRLQIAVESDEMNKNKIVSLEEMLARLESDLANLETFEKSTNVTCIESPQKSVFLQEQIKHLEEKLKVATEQAALEKQNVKTANSALWKKEKELSDSELDKRIALRELKQTEEKLKTITEEKCKLNQRLTEDKSENDKLVKEQLKTIATLTQELEQVKSESEKLQRRVDMYQNKCEVEKANCVKAQNDLKECEQQNLSLKRDIKNYESDIKALEKEITTLKDKYSSKEDQIKKAEDSVKDRIRSFEELKINNSMLKEVCAMMEDQLKELEALCDDREERTQTLQERIAELESNADSKKEEFLQAKRQLNEERSLKLVAEKKCDRLQNELSELKENMMMTMGQLSEKNEKSDDLIEQLSANEQLIASLEISLQNEKRRNEVMTSEMVMVKEEATRNLTSMYSTKEEMTRLRTEMEDKMILIESLTSHINELEDSLTELRVFYQHREVKSEATLQQYTKLIDLLQTKLEDGNKKKKSLSDKIFGGSKKENIPPLNVLPLNYRELEANLAREQAKNRTLSEQLLEAKTQLLGAKGEMLSFVKDSESALITSPRTKMALQEIVQSPSQRTSEFQRQPSKLRMLHNIPHRFEHKLCRRSARCPACPGPLPFGRQVSSCLECGVMCHHKCCHLLPATCGLPDTYAKHFAGETLGKDQEKERKEDDAVAVAVKVTDDKISKGGWVKLPQRNNSNWERRYIRLIGSSILVFSSEPTANSEATMTIKLKQDNSCTVVTPEVSETDVNNTARSDLPFIIKIEIIPTTTCWPSTTQLIMALSTEEKAQWLTALQSSLGDACVARKYTGSKYLQFRDFKMVLTVNCAIEVNANGILIGAEEGLYSYQMGCKPVHITGVTKVHQISFVRCVNMALLICGEERKLVKCDLRHLESLAQRLACVEPHLDVAEIVFPGDEKECCHLFEASDPSKSSNESSLLCAATPTRLLIFKYEKSVSLYKIVKILDTSEPISSVLFTQNTIMVCAHKFFEINTTDYTAEEFLDSSDKSLSHVIFAHKRKSFPIEVLLISSDEYLLCFNEFGVFVDGVGRRSRSQDILWSHIPISFTYRKPYLFIVHYSTVEVIKINNESFNAPEDAENYENYPPQVFIELKNPRYLGNASTKGSIYALNALNTGPEIVKLEGHLIVKNDFAYDTIDGASDVISLADSDFTAGEPIYAQINQNTKIRSQAKLQEADKTSANVYVPAKSTSTDLDSDNQSEFSFSSSVVKELDALNAEHYSSDESLTTMEMEEQQKKVRFGSKKQTEL